MNSWRLKCRVESCLRHSGNVESRGTASNQLQQFTKLSGFYDETVFAFISTLLALLLLNQSTLKAALPPSAVLEWSSIHAMLNGYFSLSFEVLNRTTILVSNKK